MTATQAFTTSPLLQIQQYKRWLIAPSSSLFQVRTCMQYDVILYTVSWKSSLIVTKVLPNSPILALILFITSNYCGKDCQRSQLCILTKNCRINLCHDSRGQKKSKNLRVKIFSSMVYYWTIYSHTEKRGFLYNYPWGHPYVIVHKMMLECMHIHKITWIYWETCFDEFV